MTSQWLRRRSTLPLASHLAQAFTQVHDGRVQGCSLAFVDGEVIGKHEGIGALTVQLPLMVTTGPKTAGDGLDLNCVIDLHHDLVQLATSVILDFNDSG